MSRRLSESVDSSLTFDEYSLRMKNKLFSIAILLPLLLGCGMADRIQKAVSEESNTNSGIANTVTNSNKTFTDKAVDTAVGEKKIGIAECDEAMELLAAQADDPEDNFVVKAGKKTALNMFREQLKKNLEDNKADKKKVAEFCSEFRDNLKESAEEESNANAEKK